MTVARATEFCVAIDNRPGTLAKVCRLLRRGRVNVHAVSVCENTQCCWVRLVASPPRAAKQVLAREGYHYISQSVLTYVAQHRPGELERIASRLGKAGVNINYLYGSNAPGAATGLVVIHVSDAARATAALR
jgi:hypothetical protein